MGSRLNYYLERLYFGYRNMDEEAYKILIANIYNENPRCDLFKFLDLIGSDYAIFYIAKVTESEIEFDKNFCHERLVCSFNLNGNYIGKKYDKDIYFTITEIDIDEESKDLTPEICDFLGIKFGIRKEKGVYKIDAIASDYNNVNNYLLISNNVNKIFEFYKEETKSNTFLDRLLNILSESNFDYNFGERKDEGKDKKDGCEIHLSYGNSLGRNILFFNENGKYCGWKRYKEDNSITIDEENILNLHGNQFDIEVCELLGIKWSLNIKHTNIFFGDDGDESEYVSSDINKLVKKYKKII